MKKTHSAVLTAMLVLSALVSLPVSSLADPGATAPKFGNYQAKGFLSDYSRISTTPTDTGAYRYIQPGMSFGNYNQLLVDRIKIFFKEDSEYQGIDPDVLKMLTDYFYQQINEKIGKDYPLVTEAGPKVLRLRIAITDLVPNKPEASLVTLVVPFAWVGEAGAGAATGQAGSTPFTGQATIEFEALDSPSSQQLAAYIQTVDAKKYNWTSGVTSGVKSYMKAYSKWDYTKQSIDTWVALLKQRLDEAHGKATQKTTSR